VSVLEELLEFAAAELLGLAEWPTIFPTLSARPVLATDVLREDRYGYAALR
jgi:hypothetical protein